MNKVLFLLLILNVILFGQDYYSTQELGLGSVGNNGWGFKAGMNIANVGGDDVNSSDDIDDKYGFNFSVFSEKAINPNVSFQWEIQYSEKGWSNSYEDSDWDYEESSEFVLSLHYLEVPLLFKYTITSSSQFMPYFNMGGVLGFNISGKTEYDYYYYYDDVSMTWEDSDSGSEDITDEINPFEFGLLFGGGVKIPTQTGKLLIDIKYNFGLTNIPDDEDFSISNRVWLLSLGYQFIM